MKKADETRRSILQKAYSLVYENGYQATSVDQIIAKTDVTKGAFYYHFKNKDEMGVAIVNEILRPALSDGFLKPLATNENPLEGIYQLVYELLIENESLAVEHGCPLGNLVQEMSPWNSIFSNALSHLTQTLTQQIVQALENGKQNGFVLESVNSRQVALFVLSGYWGVRNVGRLENSKSAYLPYLKELKNYLATLA